MSKKPRYGADRLFLWCVAWFASLTSLAAEREPAIDWPAFLARHDMVFDSLPGSWTEAPHFGNAMIGSMLFREGDAIKLQVFRADVHDHRDSESWGWTAYSRPRMQIGHFLLHTAGTPTGCQWRKDLWNAELTGTITTTKGEIRIRHFTHAADMAIVTELEPDEGEQDARWTWHPAEAITTRPGYPKDEAGLRAFAEKYGDHYAETMVVPWQPNPAGRLEKDGGVCVWIQNLLAGGQYATAWGEEDRDGIRRHVVSIVKSHPDRTAASTAAADVARFLTIDAEPWIAAHRAWWHSYYPLGFVSLPEKDLEALYWQTIYRFGCISRAGRGMVDTAGLWFQGKSWPYFTTDWNIQSGHWPVYAANRLDQGRELVDRLHKHRQNLIDAVRPVEWQDDSAYLSLAVAGDLRGGRDEDKRYYDLLGNLPWTLHNAWWQYRYSMDESLLRETVYPLLRRAVNLYLRMLKEENGTLRLPPTFSPETGVYEDCNFDLALLKWGCHTLLASCKRLGIDDPLIPRWKDVIARLPDFPADEHGFRLGSGETSSAYHQHFSHLLMMHPLFLVNIDQPEARDVMMRSLRRAQATTGPGQRQAMVQAHAGPMAAALGLGDKALASLRLLHGDLYPNGLWYESPCIESTLAAAAIIQDMLIQSWSDPASEEPGPIRVFPALPSSWEDVEFRDLRTEGAFLVSAGRTGGKTQWVRIRSLAGEPCFLHHGIDGAIDFEGPRRSMLRQAAPGLLQIDLREGEEIVIHAAEQVPGFMWNDAVPEDCPFEPSPTFRGVCFTGRHGDYRVGDTFYPSWASDGNLYSPWTDGQTDGIHASSGGGIETGHKTGHAVMTGDDPLKLEIRNTSPPKQALGLPYRGRYPCGSLVHNGIWYYGTYCLGPSAEFTVDGFKWNWPNLGPMPGFHISRDLGKTWEDPPGTPVNPLFPEPADYLGPVKMGAPKFVDYGKNMEHSPDGKAYLLGMGAVSDDPLPRPAIMPGPEGVVYVENPGATPRLRLTLRPGERVEPHRALIEAAFAEADGQPFANGNLSWVSADQVYLARVSPSPETINDLSAYEFFAGHNADGEAIWTDDFEKIQPLIEWNNHMGCVTATWVPGINRYLMCVTDGWPTVAKMTSYILEADHITGPWRMVAYLKDFGEQAYFLNFPSKFISEDGRTLWLAYSANFSPGWNGVDLKINPPGGRYGLSLHELKLLDAEP